MLALEVVFLIGCGIHCYTDYKEMLLYDGVSVFMLLAGAFYHWENNSLDYAITGALVTGGLFLLLFLVCPRGMGFGDVKLSFVLGAWLGWQQGLLCLLIALWLGFLLGMFFLALRIKNSKDAIPFGPYMCVSGVLMLYYGNTILALYCKLF